MYSGGKSSWIRFRGGRREALGTSFGVRMYGFVKNGAEGNANGFSSLFGQGVEVYAHFNVTSRWDLFRNKAMKGLRHLCLQGQVV